MQGTQVYRVSEAHQGIPDVTGNKETQASMAIRVSLEIMVKMEIQDQPLLQSIQKFQLVRGVHQDQAGTQDRKDCPGPLGPMETMESRVTLGPWAAQDYAAPGALKEKALKERRAIPEGQVYQDFREVTESKGRMGVREKVERRERWERADQGRLEWTAQGAYRALGGPRDPEGLLVGQVLQGCQSLVRVSRDHQEIQACRERQEPRDWPEHQEETVDRDARVSWEGSVLSVHPAPEVSQETRATLDLRGPLDLTACPEHRGTLDRMEIPVCKETMGSTVGRVCQEWQGVLA